jgi:hypothetical protein
MITNKFNLRHFFSVLAFLIVTSSNVLSSDHVPLKFKPFRVLVIIGDQWQDPASFMVDVAKPTGEYSGYDANPIVNGADDFHHLVILLKSWGIPFDIVRLDQQFLDRYMFLDMKNSPRYGTIIWDVNQSDKLLHPDYSIITDMVENYGIGFIALSDRISQPEIQSLLGLKYIGSWESNTSLNVTEKHFITAGLSSPFKIDSGIVEHMQRQQVEVLKGTSAIVNQGPYPQVTVREYPSGSHVVWIGNDHNWLFFFQGIRTLLRQAITWTIGFNLYKTWDNELVMIMDDPGGAQSSWLEHWHYPVLTEEIIDKYLIKPLEEHHAVLNINFVPGFVNDSERRLEPTWTKVYTDAFGVKQDYNSSKRGYDKGVKLGVFEVMCHGLTHMQPDLVSEPCWYGSALDKEKAEVGWYREFGDTRRNKEIPPAEQLWRMKTGKEWLKNQFGVTPLEFCPGGLGTSISYFGNTSKLAGEAGYGWCGWETGYLGKDMVIIGWKFFGTSESPLLVQVPPDAHDFGISREPEKFVTVFDLYPKGRFISMNEFIGYMHTQNNGSWSSGKDKLTITLSYDPDYCRYFEKHSSEWNLEFSDWILEEKGKPEILIDGKNITVSDKTIKIPRGTGEHVIEAKF